MLDLKISSIIQETSQCKTFTFTSSDFVPYLPGQFLTFIFNIRGKEIRRSYSISSSPFLDEPLSVTIKRTPNGEISRWWMDIAKPGDTVTSLLPAGRFTLQEIESGAPIYFAAAGSGIAPIYSMIKSLLSQGTTSKIYLLYSNSNTTSTIFLDSLRNLERKYSTRLQILWFFSDHENLHQARLSTYNLQHIIKKTLFEPIEKAWMYTCGPFYYMQMVQITCLTLGFKRSQIRKELFDINAVPSGIKKYYDNKDRAMTIIRDGKQYQLNVPHDVSILDAALKTGIEIPYSCKAGKCSSCVCRVLSGKVWMHYNEVLMDDEISNNVALTCTGHPASDDVIIEFD